MSICNPGHFSLYRPSKLLACNTSESDEFVGRSNQELDYPPLARSPIYQHSAKYN